MMPLRCRPLWVRLLLTAVIPLLLGVLIGLAINYATKAHACDPGSYYDPTHVICQPSPPAYNPPGFYPGPSNNPTPPYHHAPYTP